MSAEIEISAGRRRNWLKGLRRFLRNRLATAGLVITIAICLLAIFAPLLTTYDPIQMDLQNSLLPPGSAGHILGTDDFGRDLFSRIAYGARTSLVVGFFSVVLGGVVGTLLGLVSGYFGGLTDSVIMRAMDGLFAFPFILLAIIMMTVLGQGLFNVIIAISVGSVPSFARIVRGQVLSAKQEEFVEAGRALGASSPRLIFRHILPNIFTPIVVYGTLNIAGAIISEAALSFLGLGVQPPTPSWGSILKDGRNFLVLSPHMATFSGLAILLAVIGINTLGDGLRDLMDPKTHT